jgi:AP2 domain.
MIEIPLTQGHVALIDDEDYELVSQYKWCARWSPGMRSYYAVTNIRKPDGKRIHLQMHRLITNAQKGEVVDHINHNTLDNRKSELRLCTHSQNLHNQGRNSKNTSGYKGVHWYKRYKKWQAQIKLNGKKIHLGYFSTPEEAHAAYCKAALELHGEFAKVA